MELLCPTAFVYTIYLHTQIPLSFQVKAVLYYIIRLQHQTENQLSGIIISTQRCMKHVYNCWCSADFHCLHFDQVIN